MRDEILFHILNEHLKSIQKEIPIENIFGIFALSIEKDDIKSEAIVIPSFDHICTTICPIDTEVNGVKIVDVRKVYKATQCGHPEIIESLYTDYRIINPKYEHIFQKLYVCNREKFKEGAATGIPSDELRIALMKVCRLCWNETSNAVRFIKQLTDTEKTALEGITKTIGDGGVISQAKVASAIGVSRLTMTNLIMKMKFYEVATVEYLGHKGTYIKFIDDMLLDIRGEKMK